MDDRRDADGLLQGVPASPADTSTADQERWSHYLGASAVLRDSGLCCRGVGEHRGVKQPMTLRRLSTHAVLFVTEGQGTYRGYPYPDNVPVRAPALIWLFPGVPHAYGPDRHGWREHWVLFEGTAVRAYESLKVWRRTEPLVATTASVVDEIAPVFDALRRGTGSPGRRSEVLAATLTHALVGIAGEQTERVRDRSRYQPYASASEGVVASALGPATVADRARDAGLTPDRLRREVREQTSLSVHDLVIQTRLAQAQTMLATTDMPVASIARHVGYDDAAYFSRLFSARVGMAPTAFRRELGL